MSDPGEYANHPEDHLTPCQLRRKYGAQPEPEDEPDESLDHLHHLLRRLTARVDMLEREARQTREKRLTI